MLKLYITDSDLLQIEPSLYDYLRSDESDYSASLDSAKKQLFSDIRKHKKKIKNLYTPLTLTDKKSDKDIVERSRLVINVSSATGLASFELYGTDSETDEPDNLVKTLSTTEAGQLTDEIEEFYNYYKIVKTGTATFTAELVEQSFDLAYSYLSLSFIYQSKKATIDDNWDSKAKDYYERYVNELDNTIASYDEDENKEIEEEEINQMTRTRFTR